MNNNTNAWFMLGAAVVGLVSAAGVYLIEHFRHEKRRHAVSQDLARMDSQLSTLKQELEVLRQLQKDRLNNSVQSKPNRRKPRHSATSEDYTSAIDGDSSDLEFYDLSSEDENIGDKSSVDTEIKEVDKLLENESDYEEVLKKLENLNIKHPDNPNILWRLGKALKSKIDVTPSPEERKELINRGIGICEQAVDLAPGDAFCHKWLAILIGLRGEFQPTKERIQDGHLFSQHIRRALDATPNDPSLHHLLGRFTYEVAKLTWLEKTLASTLFAEMPSCTYEEAKNCFLQAEHLSKKSWKENRLFLAKCAIASGDTDEANDWLKKAENSKNEEDEKVNEEVKNLLQKYKKQ